MKAEELVKGCNYVCICTGPFEWNIISGIFTFNGQIDRRLEEQNEIHLGFLVPPELEQYELWFCEEDVKLQTREPTRVFSKTGSNV